MNSFVSVFLPRISCLRLGSCASVQKTNCASNWAELSFYSGSKSTPKPAPAVSISWPAIAWSLAAAAHLCKLLEGKTKKKEKKEVALSLSTNNNLEKPIQQITLICNFQSCIEGIEKVKGLNDFGATRSQAERFF